MNHVRVVVTKLKKSDMSIVIKKDKLSEDQKVLMDVISLLDSASRDTSLSSIVQMVEQKISHINSKVYGAATDKEVNEFLDQALHQIKVRDLLLVCCSETPVKTGGRRYT